jgi:hypothetical protein
MLALGYAEGRDFEFTSISADGDHTRLPRLAEDLVRLEPRIILANSAFGTVAVKHVVSKREPNGSVIVGDRSMVLKDKQLVIG